MTDNSDQHQRGTRWQERLERGIWMMDEDFEDVPKWKSDQYRTPHLEGRFAVRWGTNHLAALEPGCITRFDWWARDV